MTNEPTPSDVAEKDAFSASASPHPGAAGAGETSFGDADAPAASEPRADAQPGAEEAPEGQEQAPEGQEQAPESQEPAAQSKEQEYLELAKRTKADFENFRKRMTREHAAAVDRGMAKLAKELLPAFDHLELALKAAEGHEDVVKGFAMVADEIDAALNRVGIQRFSPKGEPFDPNEHEAMAQIPSEDAESGTVVEVYQSGYRINGAVLRPARVVVAQ